MKQRYRGVDNFPSYPATNSNLPITDQILCLLKDIRANQSNSSPVSNQSMIIDPFYSESVDINTNSISLAVPSVAIGCTITVKGLGELLMSFITTTDTNNSYSFIKDEIFELESIYELTKARFKSTTTNKLVITYYRYLTL